MVVGAGCGSGYQRPSLLGENNKSRGHSCLLRISVSLNGGLGGPNESPKAKGFGHYYCPFILLEKNLQVLANPVIQIVLCTHPRSLETLQSNAHCPLQYLWGSQEFSVIFTIPSLIHGKEMQVIPPTHHSISVNIFYLFLLLLMTPFITNSFSPLPWLTVLFHSHQSRSK